VRSAKSCLKNGKRREFLLDTESPLGVIVVSIPAEGTGRWPIGKILRGELQDCRSIVSAQQTCVLGC